MKIEFSTLVGKTLVEINGEKGEESIVFKTNNGEEYMLYHDQDCCEHVFVDDICGDLNDLLNCPILRAEENSNSEGYPRDNDDSFTWTFYRLETVKGSVVIRWYGSSNGYYSESVDFCKLK